MKILIQMWGEFCQFFGNFCKLMDKMTIQFLDLWIGEIKHFLIGKVWAWLKQWGTMAADISSACTIDALSNQSGNNERKHTHKCAAQCSHFSHFCCILNVANAIFLSCMWFHLQGNCCIMLKIFVFKLLTPFFHKLLTILSCAICPLQWQHMCNLVTFKRVWKFQSKWTERKMPLKQLWLFIFCQSKLQPFVFYWSLWTHFLIECHELIVFTKMSLAFEKTQIWKIGSTNFGQGFDQF